jgi:hypothetical protein
MSRNVAIGLILVVIAVLAAPLAPARADIMIDPTAILDYSSQLSSGTRGPGHLIDGTGLSDASVVETGDSVPTTWPSHTTAAEGNMWLSAGGTSVPQYVTFNLGASYDLTGTRVWNYNEPYSFTIDRGAKDVTISVAASWGGSDAATTWTSLGSFVIDQGTGATNDVGKTYTLSAGNVSVVKFTATSTYGNALVGLSEVRFLGSEYSPPPPPSPEPGTLVLLGTGLVGLLCYAWRRR